jgi:hypothetical protein
VPIMDRLMPLHIQRPPILVQPSEPRMPQVVVWRPFQKLHLTYRTNFENSRDGCAEAVAPNDARQSRFVVPRGLSAGSPNFIRSEPHYRFLPFAVIFSGGPFAFPFDPEPDRGRIRSL